MDTCSTKKNCYRSLKDAEEALLDNRARNNYAQGAGPVNVYKCELCGNYHFTSKGSPHPILSDPDKKKKIDLKSEASYWEDKFKR